MNGTSPLTIRLLASLLLAAMAAIVAVPAQAASRVYELRYAIPAEVATAIASVHGAEVQAEVVRQRLLVIGPERRLQAIDELVRELDQGPLPLRLTLALQPPPPDRNATTYRSGSGAIELSSVEGALVTIEHSRFAQQAASAGWVIDINETPSTIQAVTLQVRRRSGDLLDVVVGYSDYANGERRVLGNTRTARLGEWVSLLPTPVPTAADGTTYSTATLAPDQLWLRVEPAP